MAQKRKGRRPRGDGSVCFKPSKGCWVWRAVVGHKPDGSVLYTEGRARSQGEAVRRKQEAEKGNRRPNSDQETVADHLAQWLDDVAKPNVRPNTHRRYQQICDLHLIPRIGGIPLRKLTVGQVTRLWASLARDGMTPGTVKTCSEVLASALENAATQEKITTVPTRSATKPRVIRGPVEVFADEEVRAILRACRGDKFEALFNVAIGTGARLGEILALELDDFDLDRGTVRITKMLDIRKGEMVTQPPKSATGVRTVGLPAFAVNAIRQHVIGRVPGAVFTTRTGAYYSKTNFIKRDWAGLLTRAGVKYRRFHTLRHTHASRLLADGVDPAEVAKRIGDRIETVMRTYAHWIMTTGRDTAAKVDAIYGEPGLRLAAVDAARAS